MDNVKSDLWRKRVQGGEEIWVALRDSLRGNASEAVWAAGLNTLRLVDYHDNQIVIGAPNQIQLLRVQQRYLPFITEQAQMLVGPEVQVSLTVTDLSAAKNKPDAVLIFAVGEDKKLSPLALALDKQSGGALSKAMSLSADSISFA